MVNLELAPGTHPGNTTPWIGSQAMVGHHAHIFTHSFIARGKSELPVHIPTCFWEV